MSPSPACECSCGKKGCISYQKVSTTIAKHGMSDTHFYKIWSAMKSRCSSKRESVIKYYGFKGIKIDPDWKSFLNFKRDMFSSYKEHCNMFGERNTSLDRIDVNRSYEKKNCRWVTLKEQQRNRSNNTLLTLNGVTQCLSAWAEDLNMSVSSLGERIYHLNWTLEDALTTPKGKTGPKLPVDK